MTYILPDGIFLTQSLAIDAQQMFIKNDIKHAKCISEITLMKMKTVHLALLVCLIVGIFDIHSVSADGKLVVYFFSTFI